MLTLRASALLLAQADSFHALRPVAAALGFTSAPRRLARDVREAAGISDLVTGADLISAPGSLRLLCAQLAPPTDVGAAQDPRELTRRLAIVIAQRAPTRHWCLLAIDHSRQSVCIATVALHPDGPRIAALRVERAHVMDSDAETLRALAAVTAPSDPLRHARFTDILRRDALSRRFYRELERVVTTLATSATGSATPAEKRELALLCTSRCLFLAFLEAKGWLNHQRNFLLHHATSTLEAGGGLHERLLRPLFFGTLNTPLRRRAAAARTFGAVPFLNGGLFAPTPLENSRRRVRFTDDALTQLIGSLLDRYRFTAHEDSTAWSEAAVDPEMLGRAFECLMAGDERRRSGSFYTPPMLVEQVVEDALSQLLPSLPPDALRHTDTPLALDPLTRSSLEALRVIDPACGSGAFLVHLLERLATLYRRAGLASSMHESRRAVLTKSIFGVDRNPVAVWLCELRLWLSVVIDCVEPDITRIPPLPNLDHHIRVGDSLAGGNFRFAPPSARALATLRDRYTRATGPRKRTIAAALEREERARAIAECNRRIDLLRNERRAYVVQLRARDLFGQRHRATRSDTLRLAQLRTTCCDMQRHRDRLQRGSALPFRFATYFADVAANGGFSLVIGNPPWVRPHAIPVAERLLLRHEFRSMRHAAWRAGAARAGAGAGFAAQPDVAAAFIERSIELLAPGGTLALLVPAKLWRTLSGGGIRRYLADSCTIRALRDWSDAPALFDAATYPSLLVAQRLTVAPGTTAAAAPPARISIASHRDVLNFEIAPHALSLDGDTAAPWVLLPPAALAAFHALRLAGPSLGDSTLGRPLLGVKCGCNAAFLVHAVEHDDESATVTASATPIIRQGVIERLLLRPALRGEGIATGEAYAADHPEHELRIVWTHATDGTPLRALPPATTRWLAHWRPRLESRRDARARMPWWTLFRTEAARADTPRVVWADIGKRLRTRVLDAGDPTVPLNSCYVLRARTLQDAHALNALLQSTIAAAWLDVLAEPARGGFRRFLGWTVAALPVPPDWDSASRLLAPLGRQLAAGSVVPATLLDAAVAATFGMPLTTITPLLDWYER